MKINKNKTTIMRRKKKRIENKYNNGARENQKKFNKKTTKYERNKRRC